MLFLSILVLLVTIGSLLWNRCTDIADWIMAIIGTQALAIIVGLLLFLPLFCCLSSQTEYVLHSNYELQSWKVEKNNVSITYKVENSYFNTSKSFSEVKVVNNIDKPNLSIYTSTKRVKCNDIIEILFFTPQYINMLPDRSKEYMHTYTVIHTPEKYLKDFIEVK